MWKWPAWKEAGGSQYKALFIFLWESNYHWILCLTFVGAIDIKKLEKVACWFLAVLWKFLRPSHLDYYIQNENPSLYPRWLLPPGQASVYITCWGLGNILPLHSSDVGISCFCLFVYLVWGKYLLYIFRRCWKKDKRENPFTVCHMLPN